MKKILLHGSIDMNCYSILNKKECYIVDPGYEKARLQKWIQEEGLEVKGIFLTHAHFDHVGAIDAFKVPIYIHKIELDLLKDDTRNGFIKHQLTKSYNLEELDLRQIDENFTMVIGEDTLKVIHTPGHTAGSVCYKIKDELFTGDTLFKGTIGDCGYPTGSLEAMKVSLVNLINTLEDHVKVYSGHGGKTTIGDEKKWNPYYLEWS